MNIWYFHSELDRVHICFHHHDHLLLEPNIVLVGYLRKAHFNSTVFLCTIISDQVGMSRFTICIWLIKTANARKDEKGLLANYKLTRSNCAVMWVGGGWWCWGGDGVVEGCDGLGVGDVKMNTFFDFFLFIFFIFFFKSYIDLFQKCLL